MRFDRHAALQAFRLIVKHGSFTRAAVELGMTASALSQSLRQLESRLGVQLVQRTTRQLHLTDAGRALLQRLAPALDEIDAALAQIRDTHDQPGGCLRLTLSHTAARLCLQPWLSSFLDAYPALQLELDLNNGLVDVAAAGFDAGIRFGAALQAGMHAVPISQPLRFVVVAAPSYLARHGHPQAPPQVAAHACIRYRLPASQALYRWEFVVAGQPLALLPPGRLTCNDNALALAAALDGAGLAYLAEPLARQHLAAGSLVELLDGYLPAAEAFYLYYPDRAPLPAKLRVFIDHLRRCCGLA